MSALAVVVLGYNSGREILDCIASVRHQGPSEIVVVDNASTDGSVEMVAQRFPDVRIVRNATNRGFAAAANQGVRETTAGYVLLINPDATASPGALEALASRLDAEPNAAAVGALVRNPDGSVQPTKRAFPSLAAAAMHALIGPLWSNNPGTRAYVLADAAFGAPRRVDWVSCTATVLRRSVFEAVGGFDESFFFFVEDVDLCRRLTRAGYEIWFEPEAEVVHIWGGAWTRRPIRFIWMHQANVFRYVRKHYRGGWVAAYPLIAAALFGRFVLLAARWLITGRSVPGHREVAHGEETS